MKWSRVRRLVQGLALVAFVLLTCSSVGLGWSWLPGNLFSRLDPLVGLVAILASRALIAFWAAALVTLVLTTLLGRAWCGWICPLGTLIEVMPARRRKPRSRISTRWSAAKYVTLAVVLGAALLGSLAPMILDPITIVTRPLQELARPFVGTDAVGLAGGVYIARSGIRAVALLSLVMLGFVVALNAVEQRVWCRDLCPLGGLLGVVARVPGVRRIVDEAACTSCGRCSAACPTDAIDRSRGHATRVGECIDCLLCVDACPTGANRFAVVPQPRLPVFRQERRDAVVAAGAVGLGLGAALLPGSRGPDAILRPPATDGERLSRLCVRCGACYGACPTGVLRPSVSFVSEAGPWTPMLDERPAHCTLNCNRCARPCPTDAIHTPTPEEAGALGLGAVAAVHRERCRAWAHNHACMLCQQKCPIPGALIGQERPYDPSRPTQQPVEVPVVVESECVGCNQCTTGCPAVPPAIGVGLPSNVGTGQMPPAQMPRVRTRKL